MKAFRTLHLVGLLLLQVSPGFCGLRCELENWDHEILRCVPLGPLKNSIKPRETNNKNTDEYEDIIPLGTFQKYDWSAIKTFVLKNANLKNIHQDLFAGASSLENLDLSGNEDLRIRDSFTHLINLRTLRLSESSLNSRSDIDEVLKLPKLQSLNISNMRWSKIMAPHIFLKDLKRLPNLENLDASGNNIGDLRQYNFSRNLKSLDLSHNRLTIGDRNFESATNLTFLFLSNSSINNIPVNAFVGTKITHLDLSFNSIPFESLPCLRPSMTRISLSHNGLRHIPFSLNILSKSVEVLDISYNHIRSLDQLSADNTRNVRSLNAAHNILFTSDGFYGFVELLDLDLSSNLIITLPAYSFAGALKLETLKLAGNKLYQIAENTFNPNTALVYLSLRSNFLTSLDVRTFKGLSKLRELDLSNNNLKSVPYDLLYESRLHLLNLSCNWLSFLPDNFFNEFSRNGKLILYGNPWKCACVSKVLDKFSIDAQFFVDGSHPSCYVKDKIDKTCGDAALNGSDIENWIYARKASAIPC